MLIKEIEPIEDRGINLLEKDNPDEIIDKIIELPLRKACKILRQKGIETVMSSANQTNLLRKGEKRKEKEDLIPNNTISIEEGWRLSNSDITLKDAGCGYVWIMLNFDTLSDENKDLLFDLEERKDVEDNPIGEKGIWFVHPFVIGNLDYKIRSGQINYEEVRDFLDDKDEAIFAKIEKDERLEKFENKSIILSYDGGKYPTQTVVVRMPISEETTVEEVETYFCQFARSLREQRREKEVSYGKNEIEEEIK